MRYYISDLHFYHESLLDRMDRRGFASCGEMHDYMIGRWNAKVRPGDEVVILGDVSMERGKLTSDILARLNGRLSLITGNHDKYLNDRRFDRTRFEWIKPYEELHDNKRKVILSHYPVFCYNGQYRRDRDGVPKTYMLYGHVHDTHDEVLVNHFIRETRQQMHQNPGDGEPMPIPCQMINCFCMFSDYTPLSLDEWIVVDRERRERMEALREASKVDGVFMDVMTKEQRRRNMQHIRSQDTKIEVILRKALWARGHRYRKNYKKLPGKPDIVLTKYGIAIFCDGEFFHGKDWEVLRPRLERGNNSDFWISKISRNRQRDDEVNKRLLFEGWTVIRFWGDEIKKNVEECVRVVEETISDLEMEGDYFEL